jgi:hypothetical protein
MVMARHQQHPNLISQTGTSARMSHDKFDMQSVTATAAATAGEAPEGPAGRRKNVSGDASLDEDNKEERHVSGNKFHAPPESQLDCQGVSRKGGEKNNDQIVANQIVEEKSNEQLYTLDNKPCKEQHDNVHQQQFDPQHKQFKACFKAEYHQSIPLPIRVLEDIDRERRTYAVTATLQYFKELPMIADNPVWGKDSDSDDHYTKHQNNATRKSRGALSRMANLKTRRQARVKELAELKLQALVLA